MRNPFLVVSSLRWFIANEAVEIDVARQLDPFSPITNTLCAEFRFHARRYDQAIPLLARTFEFDPHFWVAHVVSAKICQHLEHYDEALEASQKASQFSGGHTEANSLIGFSYALMGGRSEAERVLQELQGLSMQKFVPPYNLATVYLGLGDTEKTLEWLEQAYQERDVHLVFLGVEPKWDVLRHNPRFQSLLRRLALM